MLISKSVGSGRIHGSFALQGASAFKKNNRRHGLKSIRFLFLPFQAVLAIWFLLCFQRFYCCDKFYFLRYPISTRCKVITGTLANQEPVLENRLPRVPVGGGGGPVAEGELLSSP